MGGEFVYNLFYQSTRCNGSLDENEISLVQQLLDKLIKLNTNLQHRIFKCSRCFVVCSVMGELQNNRTTIKNDMTMSRYGYSNVYRLMLLN